MFGPRLRALAAIAALMLPSALFASEGNADPAPPVRPGAVVWPLPTNAVLVPQSDVEKAEGQNSGRPLPAPELLRPELDPPAQALCANLRPDHQPQLQRRLVGCPARARRRVGRGIPQVPSRLFADNRQADGGQLGHTGADQGEPRFRLRQPRTQTDRHFGLLRKIRLSAVLGVDFGRELALRLEAWLATPAGGPSAESWLRGQAAYDLWQAAKKGRPKVRRVAVFA